MTPGTTEHSAPSGVQHELTYDGQRATVVAVGAGLRSYRTATAEIVDGYRRDEACEGSRGQLLLPWPNRIAAARYSFDGHDLQLPVNEPRTGTAIHGLTRSMTWSCVDGTANAVTLGLDLHAQEGYPFELRFEITYTLDSAGLTAVTTAMNRGRTPCPYGAGAHPYVCLGNGALIDEAMLHVPADATLEADGRGIPTGVILPVAASDFDFRSPRQVGSLRLDTAYASLRADSDGITRISLTTLDGERGVTVWMDATHSFAMLYSGDTLGDAERRRRGLAIEPMTCAPDAFNSGIGLIALEPGESSVSTWGINPIDRSST